MSTQGTEKDKGTEVEEKRAGKCYLSKVMKELAHHVKVSGCPCKV